MVYHRISPYQKERALYLHLEEGWGSSTCCCSWGIAQSIERIEWWEANSSKSTHSYTHFGSFDAANGAALSEPFHRVPGIRSGERSCMRGRMCKSRLRVLGADRLRDRLEYSSVSYKGNQYYQSETKDLRVNREEDMKTTPNGSTGKTAEKSQKSQRFGWERKKDGRVKGCRCASSPEANFMKVLLRELAVSESRRSHLFHSGEGVSDRI
ncbi:hypothetical protein EDB19DRAFT_1828126 [Suillus lakei]|nr:hypothetical protein EDB19DRAFT_1828126 [Suillus lakei]